jgi:hypothetical protein
MALTSSGQIKFSDINVELGVAANTPRKLSDSEVRTLFGVASGRIALRDGYGKSSIVDSSPVPLEPEYIQSSSLLFMRAITYGTNKYVAVGADWYSGAAGFFTTSTDTTRFVAPALFNGFADNFSVYGLAYGNGVFVASGWGGVGPNHFISTSTNGTTWSTPSRANVSNVGSNYQYGLAYGNGIFVSVGSSGSSIPTYATSVNGSTWSTVNTMPFGAGNGSMYAVTYTGSNWVAVGSTNGQIGFYSTSTNGSSWTAPAVFNEETTGVVLSVASNGSGTVVAVGGGSGAIPGLSGFGPTWFSYSTNNGTSWSTPTTFPDTLGTDAIVMTSIIYDTINNQFFAVGATSTGSAVYGSSNNGITWNGLYEIAGPISVNPQAVAVNSAGTRKVMVGMDINNGNYPTFVYI